MHPQALLAAATETAGLIFEFQYPADAVLSRYFRTHRSLGPRERNTLAETAYALLRRKTLFDHWVQSVAPGERSLGSKAQRYAMLAFAAPRAFLFSALTPGQRDWVQAFDDLDVSSLPESCRHNLPQWLADALHAEVREEFAALSQGLLEQAPLDLRVNTFKDKRDVVLKALRDDGVPASPTPHSPLGVRLQGKPPINRHALFTDGMVEVQDEGSQLLAALVDARRGEMVVDFCAGAGGKTLALGAAMRSTGRLYAFDVSAHRLQALTPRLARSGLSNVHPVVIAHERDERVKRLAGKIDRVLVDAPCSGFGTLRRNPDLKWRLTVADIDELVAKQRAILDAAAGLLKPGGRLVYATCSLLSSENEAIAEAFTQATDGRYEVLAVDQLLEDLKVPAAKTLTTPDGRYLRLWPHQHHTDGFFAAVWQRAV